MKNKESLNAKPVDPLEKTHTQSGAPPSPPPRRNNWLYLSLAFLCVGLGAVGAVVPVLPTVPFLLLASFLFSKGSRRYHRWFVGTKLYRKHLKDFAESRSMTLKSKLSILLPVTALLVLMMVLVGNRYMTGGLIILILVKYYYFIFRIRTLRPEDKASGSDILSENRRA